MLNNNLGRFIAAILVIIVLMALTTKYALNDKTNWQSVAAKGLNVKIQTGLTQMYWQWQQQGRADQIEYKPENVKQAFVISMSEKGFPKVKNNRDGCLEFLSWFVEENSLSKKLEMTTTYIERDLTNRILLNDENSDTTVTHVCQFSYASKRLNYDLETGRFTFTD